MATKSITITTDAYEKLSILKETGESFSDVINKLAKKHSLFDIVGLLSESEGRELKKDILSRRKSIREKLDSVAFRLK